MEEKVKEQINEKLSTIKALADAIVVIGVSGTQASPLPDSLQVLGSLIIGMTAELQEILS
jgi:hypothetical protein